MFCFWKKKMEKKIFKMLMFSYTPGPRYIREGSDSAEKLLKTFIPLFQNAIQDKVIIVFDLDGVAGYGAAFLDEVFSGLVRSIDYKTLLKHLEIVSTEEPYLIDEIYGDMKETQSTLNE